MTKVKSFCVKLDVRTVLGTITALANLMPHERA